MPRLFGFEDMAYRRVRESEAEGIRGAASRRLLQQSYIAVAEWINEAGYRTTRGGPFKPDVIAKILNHPAIAGLTEDEGGDLVETGGPAIIPREDFEAIRALRPVNNPGAQRVAQRDYLIDGALGVCGLCGYSLGAQPSNAGSRGYRCMPSSPQHPGGCGKVRINADLFETYVGEHVLAELAKPEVSALIEQARDQVLIEAVELRKRVEADRRKQKELGEGYARSEVSPSAFKAADRVLTQQVRDNATKARFMEQVRHAPVGGVPDLVRWWQHAPLVSRKGLVVLMLEKVAVYPAASRGSRTVDSDRVALHWRSWNRLAAA